MCGCREGIEGATQHVVTRGHATSQHGDTALIGAVRCGYKEMVELLADSGANLEAKNRVSAATVCVLRDGPRRASRAGGGVAMALTRRRAVLLSRSG